MSLRFYKLKNFISPILDTHKYLYMDKKMLYAVPSKKTLLCWFEDVFTSTLLKMIDVGWLFANLLPIHTWTNKHDLCLIISSNKCGCSILF